MIDRSKITMIIATNDTQLRQKDSFESLGYKVISIESNGENALATILHHHPDVVVSDVYLPQLDALGLLEELNNNAYKGVFLCLENVANEALTERLMSAGAGYVLARPYSLDYLAHRIDDCLLNQNKSTSSSTEKQIADKYDLERCVSELMHQIGIPAHIRGYQYIREAIILSLNNSDMLNAITKELYPTVAREYKTTASRVERAIRHAIEVAWTRGDIEMLNAIFGYTIKTSKGKPTNGEFISMLTDRLRISLKIS